MNTTTRPVFTKGLHQLLQWVPIPAKFPTRLTISLLFIVDANHSLFLFFFFFFWCVWIDWFCWFMSYSFNFFVVYKWWRPIKLHQNDGSPSIVLLYFRYCCWIVCNGNCICHYLLFCFCLYCSKFGMKKNRRKEENTRNYFCFIFLGLLRCFNLPVVY